MKQQAYQAVNAGEYSGPKPNKSSLISAHVKNEPVNWYAYGDALSPGLETLPNFKQLRMRID